MEHQRQFGFDDYIENFQKKTDISTVDRICEHRKNDLWVDKYRPQKFTQLITMDVKNYWGNFYNLFLVEL